MTTNIKPEITSSCTICGISITDSGQVNFSHGSPGTRARLYVRVCQYTQKPGCINQKPELIGEVNPSDEFESGEDLKRELGAVLNYE